MSEQGAVGAIYGITKGHDYGTMELAYYMDSAVEGQGVMGASVGALALAQDGDRTRYYTTQAKK